jgi:hypothetical protein
LVGSAKPTARAGSHGESPLHNLSEVGRASSPCLWNHPRLNSTAGQPIQREKSHAVRQDKAGYDDSFPRVRRANSVLKFFDVGDGHPGALPVDGRSRYIGCKKTSRLHANSISLQELLDNSDIRGGVDAAASDGTPNIFQCIPPHVEPSRRSTRTMRIARFGLECLLERHKRDFIFHTRSCRVCYLGFFCLKRSNGKPHHLL